MIATSPYALATCQPGMERALKAEVARLRPDLHSGFQRPGLVTFKATRNPFRPDEAPATVFSRLWAASAGPCLTADAVLATAADIGTVRLFLSPRDVSPSDDHPPALRAALGDEIAGWERALRPAFTRGPIAPGELVLDVLVWPGEAPVVGWHRHAPDRHQEPGGALSVAVPADVPSRGYRKIAEALHTFKPALRSGDPVLEIGAAPGGGTLAWLDAGCRVVAVDPQPLHARVRENAGVMPVAARLGDVTAAALPPGIRWVSCDAGITAEDLLHALVRLRPALQQVRGWVLLLPIPDAAAAGRLPATLVKLRELGATKVVARHLPGNRGDVAVFAQR
jgi:hypothetical protein